MLFRRVGAPSFFLLHSIPLCKCITPSFWNTVFHWPLWSRWFTNHFPGHFYTIFLQAIHIYPANKYWNVSGLSPQTSFLLSLAFLFWWSHPYSQLQLTPIYTWGCVLRAPERCSDFLTWLRCLKGPSCSSHIQSCFRNLWDLSEWHHHPCRYSGQKSKNWPICSNILPVLLPYHFL